MIAMPPFAPTARPAVPATPAAGVSLGTVGRVAEARPGPSPKEAPELLHPALWLGHQLGRQVESPLSSGFPLLDAQLPGGGWPRRALSELLLPHPGVGEMRLLSPCLARIQQAGRLVMLFDPPEKLCAWALAQMGLDVPELLVIQTRCKVIAGTDSLWALEQALKSGHVGAVVAWLPQPLRAERLRRLQLAAHAHDGPAFVFRETTAQNRPTAAPLRLGLRAGGGDALELRVLKRRGPPLESALRLDLSPVLPAAARRRAEQAEPTHDSAWPAEAWQPAELHAATFINLASS